MYNYVLESGHTTIFNGTIVEKSPNYYLTLFTGSEDECKEFIEYVKKCNSFGTVKFSFSATILGNEFVADGFVYTISLQTIYAAVLDTSSSEITVKEFGITNNLDGTYSINAPVA